MAPATKTLPDRLDPADRRGIEERLRHHLAEVAPARDIVAAWLFGSVARGTPHRKSDVDVALLFSSPPPSTLEGLHLDLEDDLTELLGLPAQLVVLNRASADLIHHVLVDGRLLFDRDPAARIAFEVRSRNEYFDLLPILRRYRKEVLA